MLLGLAVLASHLPALVVLPALFGPLGHELVVRLGSRREFADGPALTPVAEGLTVLDVFPQSGAARAGIRTGDLIRSVDGRPVETTTLFGEPSAPSAPVDSGESEAGTGVAVGPVVKVVLSREGRELTLDVTLSRLAPGEEPMLGVIPVPAANTPPQLEVHSQGYFARLLARLTRSRK